MALNVLLAAEESAGLQTLKLIQSRKEEFKLKAVLTGTGDEHTAGPVHTLAKRFGCIVFPAENVKKPEFAKWMLKQKIDILLNVHSLYLIHPEVVTAPKMGAYNLHPGLLPEYAGLNTPSWSIYNREQAHGVSLHRIEAGVDTGNVIYERSIPAEATDTGLSVSLKCAKTGIEMISNLLDDALKNQIPEGRIQNLENRSYYKKHSVPLNGEINWAASAAETDALIRASNYAPFASPWGTPYSYIGGERYAVSKSVMTSESSTGLPGSIRISEGRVLVATGDHDLILTDMRSNSKKLSEDEISKLNGKRFDTGACQE